MSHTARHTTPPTLNDVLSGAATLLDVPGYVRVPDEFGGGVVHISCYAATIARRHEIRYEEGIRKWLDKELGPGRRRLPEDPDHRSPNAKEDPRARNRVIRRPIVVSRSTLQLIGG